MSTLSVRARIAAGPEPRFERLYDGLTHDLVSGGPLSRERFATRWSDGPALERLAQAKRSPLPAGLARELGETHRRLGASQQSLVALDRLARGEAVCAVAGQQPAPLGGPLYSLHKIASAVGIARALEARTRVPCVPLFWMHGEDSDFAEIRSASIASGSLAMLELSLPREAHRDGGLVGNIGTAPLEALEREAANHWGPLAGAADAAALLARSRGRARDFGEAFAALALELFAGHGLVVLDPRGAAFRSAARGVIDRYLDRAEALAAAAGAAGDSLERSLGRRPLAGPSLESFVFAIEDGTRRKLTVAEARAGGSVLSPSVALRPVVQDGVLPTVAMACGPGELAYLAQLREVYELLEVRPACPVPRFGATWLPPPAVSLLEAAGADAWDVVSGADSVLRALAERRVPAEVRAALDRAREGAVSGLASFGEASRKVDASLPQMVESARAKVDFQFARLLEGLAGKVRHRLEHEHPEWPRVRYYLMPGDRLQERRLASLEVIAYRGAAAVGEVVELALEHAQRLERGMHEHFIVEL